MVSILDLSSEFQLALTQRRLYTQETEERVEELWQAALSQGDSRLFNGQIFSASSYTSDGIWGFFTEYRYLIAQRMDPRLKPILNIRPVSLLGFLTCKDGILFGRRQSWVATRPNQWGFLPSGYVHPDTFASNGSIDYVKAFLLHLKDETNIEAHYLKDLFVHSLAVNKEAEGDTLSLVLRADIALSSMAVKKGHLSAMEDEYSEIACVPQADIDAFLQGKTNADMQIASALLSEEGYLTLESDCA